MSTNSSVNSSTSSTTGQQQAPMVEQTAPTHHQRYNNNRGGHNSYQHNYKRYNNHYNTGYGQHQYKERETSESYQAATTTEPSSNSEFNELGNSYSDFGDGVNFDSKNGESGAQNQSVRPVYQNGRGNMNSGRGGYSNRGGFMNRGGGYNNRGNYHSYNNQHHFNNHHRNMNNKTPRDYQNHYESGGPNSKRMRHNDDNLDENKVSASENQSNSSQLSAGELNEDNNKDHVNDDHDDGTESLSQSETFNGETSSKPIVNQVISLSSLMSMNLEPVMLNQTATSDNNGFKANNHHQFNNNNTSRTNNNFKTASSGPYNNNNGVSNHTIPSRSNSFQNNKRGSYNGSSGQQNRPVGLMNLGGTSSSSEPVKYNTDQTGSSNGATTSINNNINKKPKFESVKNPTEQKREIKPNSAAAAALAIANRSNSQPSSTPLIGPVINGNGIPPMNVPPPAIPKTLPRSGQAVKYPTGVPAPLPPPPGALYPHPSMYPPLPTGMIPSPATMGGPVGSTSIPPKPVTGAYPDPTSYAYQYWWQQQQQQYYQQWQWAQMQQYAMSSAKATTSSVQPPLPPLPPPPPPPPPPPDKA